MAGLDPLELDIRRWWHRYKTSYENGTSTWIDCPNWPLWKQIGYLLAAIDKLHHQQRQTELAADENKDTEHLSAVFRPRPPSSDDTLAVQWAPGMPSAALTPRKPFPSVPLPRLGHELPHPAPDDSPSTPSHHALDPLVHNRLIMACEIAAEAAMNGCIAHSSNPYVTMAKVLTAIKALRVAVPMDIPLDDDGHTQ